MTEGHVPSVEQSLSSLIPVGISAFAQMFVGEHTGGCIALNLRRRKVPSTRWSVHTATVSLRYTELRTENIAAKNIMFWTDLEYAKVSNLIW